MPSNSPLEAAEEDEDFPLYENKNPFADTNENDDDDNYDDDDDDGDNDDDDALMRFSVFQYPKQSPPTKKESSASPAKNPFDDDDDIEADDSFDAPPRSDSLKTDSSGGSAGDPTSLFSTRNMDFAREENKEPEPKELSRSEERNRLVEMTQLVSSTHTMEYDNSDDEDNLLVLDGSDDGSHKSATSKKKSSRFGNGWFSTKVGKVYNTDSYKNSDPYFGLNDTDGPNKRKKTTGKLSKGDQIILKIIGPVAWEYRGSLLLALIFSLIAIMGLTLGFFKLKRENRTFQKELDEQESRGKKNLSLPIIMESLAPSVVPLPQNITMAAKSNETTFQENFTKTNDTMTMSPTVTATRTPTPSNIINISKTDREKDELIQANKWLLPSSLCESNNLSIKYSLMGCLDGNVEGGGENEMVSGASIASSANGAMIAVGIQTERRLPISMMVPNPGVVQVYQYNQKDSNEGQWEDYWDIPNTDAEESFGYAVSLSGDGTRLAISSPSYDRNRGRVQVFQQSKPVSNNNHLQEGDENPRNIEWIPMNNEVSIGEHIDSQEGYAIDLSHDGTYLAIGAKGYNCFNELENTTLSKCGRVRVYEHSPESGIWLQKGSDLIGKYEGDQFGASVSLTEHGSKLAVGGWNNLETNNRGANLAVYEFQSLGWVKTLDSSFNSTQINAFDKAGRPSVSLSLDGEALAMTLGPVMPNEKNYDIFSWNEVYEYMNETKVWSPRGPDFKKLISEEDVPATLWKPNIAALSGDGSRVSFLSGAGVIHEYMWNDQGDWIHIGDIERGDYFSKDSFPAAMTLSKDGSHLALVMVRVFDGSQNAISLVYKVDR